MPAGVRGNDTLYVMTGWQPLAWLTVFADRFGERVDFVRVSGNLAMAPSDAMGQFVSHRITSHQGPIRSLTNVFETAAAPADLARFKLAIIASSCMTIRSKADPVQSCALRPLDDGARHDSESASSI